MATKTTTTSKETKAILKLLDAFSDLIAAIKLQGEMNKIVMQQISAQDQKLEDIYSYVDDIRNATERLEAKP